MANQIGSFFESMPDRAQAIEDIASHIKRFWEPRMRRAILASIDQHQDAAMSEIPPRLARLMADAASALQALLHRYSLGGKDV
eukprot:gene58728-78350_t